VKGTRSTLEYVTYVVYRSTPFVYDLGVLLEWSVTRNGLTNTQWINLNDLSHELYMRDVEIYDEREMAKHAKGGRHYATPLAWKLKQGWVLFFLLALVLLFPLFAYSSLSPAAGTNSASGITMELSMPGAPALWTGAVVTPTSTTQVSQSTVDLIAKTRHSLLSSGLNNGVPQAVSFSKYSASLWDISPPARTVLIDNLQTAVLPAYIEVMVTVTSSIATNGVSVRSAVSHRALSVPERSRLRDVLLTNTSTETIIVTGLYMPFVFNDPSAVSFASAVAADWSACNLTYNTETPPHSQSAGYFGLQCTTIFAASNPAAGGLGQLTPQESSCLSNPEACPDYELNPPVPVYDTPFLFVVSSPALSVGLLQSVGLIAAYTTFVLAIGRIVRFAFSGGAYRVTLENLQDPGVLINLIEYISMVRARGEHGEERRVFSKLMYIVRVTEVLERKTRIKEV
jgi:hypothetical protein